MRTTNIEPLLEAIKNIEKEDLIAALKAHGGSYHFIEDDEHLLPPIEFYDDLKGPKAADVNGASVESVSDSGKETIILFITDEDNEQYEIEADDLYPGMMSGITQAITEPGK